MPDGMPATQSGSPDAIEAAVRAVLGSLSGALSATEAALLGELHALGQEVKRAKSEIASLHADGVSASHIPNATDELDAVLAHTATATNEILDCCETLETLAGTLSGEAATALGNAVTRIYEACSFQDITGQRIAKVVSALQAIERRVTAATSGYAKAPEPDRSGLTEGQRLAEGPQLPGAGTSQADIDRLLASFD
jgi:chemotaxis protein CheZ